MSPKKRPSRLGSLATWRTGLAALAALALPATMITPTAASTVLPARFDIEPSPVLISEVAAGGQGATLQSNRDGGQNFIELTNYGDDAMDISGWQIFRCGQAGSGYGPQAVVEDGTVLAPGDQFTAVAEDSDYEGDATYATNLHSFGFGAFIQDADGQRRDAIGFYHEDVTTDCKTNDGEWLQRGLQHRLDESHQRVGNTGDLESDWVIAPRTVDTPNATEQDVPRVDNGLRFSELNSGGAGSSLDQYVEITNYGDESVDMTDYQLFRCGANGSQYLQVSAFPEDAVLAPGQSYLAARSGGAYADQADVTYGTAMHWRDFGAVLFTPQDEIVDLVGAYSNRNSPCTDGAPIGERLNHFDSTTFQRVSDTGDNSSDFIVTATRTPGVEDADTDYAPAPTFTGFQDVRISEVVAAGPAGGGDEFFELGNYGDQPVNLAGWSAYRCYGTGQPGVGASAQIADLGDITLAPGETYLGVSDSAPASLQEMADGTYGTGLNQTDGYGMYITDADASLVDAFAAYDINDDNYTPCRLGEQARDWTKNDEGESYTRAQFLGDNELDYVVTPRTPGVLEDATYVDPTVPLDGELDPVTVDTNHIPGSPAVAGEGHEVTVTTEDEGGTTLDIEVSTADELGTEGAVVHSGVSDVPVPTTLEGTDEQVVEDTTAPVAEGTTGSYPYLRFEVPADGESEFVWSGTAQARNELQLLVWQPKDEAWRVADARVPSADGDLTLTADVASDEITGDTAYVMVMDGPRTQGGLIDEIGVTDQAFANPGSYDVAINHMTDTQFYAEGFRDVFRQMATWVVANADARKIGYNSHTGDIIENWMNGNHAPERADREFQAAQDIMTMINDAEIPNGVLPGNHDNMWGHDNEKYNNYFPVEMYDDKPWYGQAWAEGDNAAHTDYFSASGIDFLVVSLPYRPSLEMMDWASEQAAAHPDHNVILATHSYLHTSGVRDNSDLRYQGNADDMWERVVAPNDNVFLVFGGHYHGTSTYIADPVTGERSPVNHVSGGATAVENVGSTGRTVVEMLADYQGYRSTLLDDPTVVRSDLLDRDTGFQRLLQFDIDAALMAVNAYSPTLDSFEAWRYDEPAFRGEAARYDAADDEFVVGVHLLRSTSVTSTGWSLTGPSTVVATGATTPGAEVAVSLPESDADQLWFATVTDADGNVVRSEPTVLEAAEQDPEAALAALDATLEDYIASGDVTRPSDKQLGNTLDQAQRHLADGRTDQSVSALERFVRHLDITKRPGSISDEAREDLRGQAEAVLDQLG
ncbi:lamin tail domain-containing protein [Ornithinimicrobium faecis]|uniref:lamin tail domain-containing protein n=1 Tax=Ornithinimicrobium faecis TaxID=2934158 RepID=UPI002118EC72|nr:lamin tail domain-containing protein [Ornithinimicrobium sp. HY1745]